MCRACMLLDTTMAAPPDCKVSQCCSHAMALVDTVGPVIGSLSPNLHVELMQCSSCTNMVHVGNSVGGDSDKAAATQERNVWSALCIAATTAIGCKWVNMVVLM